MADQVVSSGFTVSAWKANYGQKWEDFSVISGGGATGSVAASAFTGTGVAAAYDTIMINATVSSGGAMNLFDVAKGHASADIRPAIYLSGFTVLQGAKTVFVRGVNASAFDGIVSGGIVYVQNGGYVSNLDVYKGAVVSAYRNSNSDPTKYIADQDKNYKQRIYDLTIHSGGSVYFGNMNEVYNANVLSGGILSAYSTVAQASGTIISGLNVEKGGRGALAGGGVRVDMSKGNTAYNLALNFARVNVSNGAKVYDGMTSGGAGFFVYGGGYGSKFTIGKGGNVHVYGGNVENVKVMSGGNVAVMTYYNAVGSASNVTVSSGGKLKIGNVSDSNRSGGIVSNATLLSGGILELNNSRGVVYNLNASSGAVVSTFVSGSFANKEVGFGGSNTNIVKGTLKFAADAYAENGVLYGYKQTSNFTFGVFDGLTVQDAVVASGTIRLGDAGRAYGGGTLNNLTLQSGATLDFNSTGKVYDLQAYEGAVVSLGVGESAGKSVQNYNFGLGGSQTNIAKGVISFAKDAYAENGVLHDYKQNSWTNFEVLSGLVVDGAELSGGTMTLYNAATIANLEYTGGSLVNSGNAVLIEGIHMSGCTTDRIGNNAQLTIRGTAEKRALFEDNHRTGSNAACINGGTGITIECADFLNNSSSNSGGCISDAWATTTYLTIKDSYFYGNKAGQGGAALIYDDGKNASISGSTFTANSVSASGGVFYFTENTGLTTTPKNNSTMTVSGSLFDKNIGSDGGAITMTMGTVSISDTVFTGNTATGSIGGGAFYMTSTKCGKLTPPVYTVADVTISNAKFLNNIAVNNVADGGAIKATAGSLTINGTLFEGNTAGSSAGALLLMTGSTATAKVSTSISGSTFSKNFAKQMSAIYNKNADLSIENTIFDANVAASYSAAAVGVEGSASTATIKDSVFSNNVAKGYCAGAVRNSAAVVGISGSTFTANTANEQGGAVYNNSSLTVSDSIFDGNQVLNYGGALRNDGGTASVSGSTFSFNGGSFGGAIANNKQLAVSGSLFKSNKGISGGAMYNTGSATVSDSVFESNSASGYGAAIRNEGGSGAVSVSGSIFNNNTAYHGGAIGNNKLLEVAGSTFTCNSASRGGAIYNIGNLTVKDSFFAGNISKLTATSGTGGGGAIFNTVSASAYIDGCTFVANSTTDNHVHASAVYSEGYLTIKDSNFIGNVAGGKTISSSGASGAVHANGGTAAITGSLFEKNFAAWDGAALLGWGEYSVSDTRFNANTAHLGGAAFLSGAKDYFDHCEFTNNVALTEPDSKANGVGGAVFLYTDVKATTTRNFTFTNSEFSGNSATSQGGALSQSVKGTAAASTAITVNTSLDISGSVFENNVAVTGSAVYVYINKNVSAAGSTAAVNGVVTANNAVFNANTAADTGSSTLYLGRANGAGITANMTGATFTNNIAGEAAGIRNSGGTLAVTDGYFAGNRTTKYGAAAIYTTGVATVTASLFENNIGVTNGGAVRNDSGNLTIDGSVFSGNTAGSAGGAIYSNNKQLTVANSLFSGNASYQGGAVYNTSIGTASISGSTFTGNFGTFGAAVAVSSGSTVSSSVLKVTGSTFTGNVALSSGAAIRTYDAKCVLTVENCVFDGNEALYGGAMYTSGTITVKDSSFLQASDTIANYGVMTIQGTNYFGGNFTGNGTGTVVLDGATVTFAGDTVNMKITKQGTGNLWIFENEIATDVLREFAADAITFKGETVRFTQQSAATPGPLDLTGIAISVDCTLPDANTTLVVASNVVNVDKASSFKLHGVDVDTDFTATVDGFKYQIGYDTVSQSITVNAVVNEVTQAGSIVSKENKVADGYAAKFTENTTVSETTFAAGSDSADNIYLSLDGVNSSKIILGGGDGRECASREGKNDIKLTAGTVSTIYGGGYNQDQKEVEIKLDGGTVTGDIFGGSRITDGGTHSVDTVVMTIDQNVASEGKSAYGAGFATKAGSVLNNTDTVISVAGGNLGKSTAGEGVFGGGFADAGAQVNTENVNISLTGGIVGNIFGAGWAQQGGKVSVENVNILVAGVEKGGVIYGGGAHSNESESNTSVGTVNISVTSANGFGSIYAGGQIDTKGSDSVGSATITVTGSDTLTNNFFGQGYQGADTVAAGQSVLLFSDFTGSVTKEIADFDFVKLSGDTAANLTGATLNNQDNDWILDFTERGVANAAKTAADFTNVKGEFELKIGASVNDVASWKLISAELDSIGDDWSLGISYEGGEVQKVALGGSITLGGTDWELKAQDANSDEGDTRLVMLSKKTTL